MAETKHERLTADKIDKLEHRAEQVAMGYDTGAIARHYSTDVRYLLKEIELLRADGHTKDQALGIINALAVGTYDPAGDNGIAKGGDTINAVKVLIDQTSKVMTTQKLDFEWPWVPSAGTPVEAMTMCLTVFSKLVNGAGPDVGIEEITDEAHGLLVLFGDPLAPKIEGVMEAANEDFGGRDHQR